ncbi:coatomer subunit beta [Sorochytrium milnesiophthora]
MDSNCYTIIRQSDSQDVPTMEWLKGQLERGTDEQKIQTMKKLLKGMLNGEPYHQLLMHVIRFVMPSRNKHLKKLTHMFWEICPKHDASGKLKHEMILVCNALLNDLQHPNEYIRGATLRLISKLRDAELLESLISPCRSNLEHRHPYVRKNAVLAIFSIYKYNDILIPDAPELVSNYLANESDMGCRRNAFVMLQNTAPERAVAYLASVASQIPNFDEMLQLVIIELMRKEARNNANDKSRYIRMIHALLQAPSHAVKYEAASSLVSLTSAAPAVKAAATAYVELVLKESDNNVKLIVLDGINELREKHDRMLDDMVMDLLRVLQSPDIEVRKKCLQVAMEMVSNKNVDEVTGYLKKELLKTQDGEFEKNAEYRQTLIQAIHTCAIRFPEVAASVVHVLMDFLSDTSNASAVDVIAFVREVIERFPALTESILNKLYECFLELRSGKVVRGALWIMGEYSADLTTMEESLRAIRKSIGDIPIMTASEKQQQAEAQAAGDAKAEPSPKTPTSAQTQRRVLADGTYATESAFTSKASTKSDAKGQKLPLRALLLNGDYYTGAVLSTALTKLSLRYNEQCQEAPKVNDYVSQAMLIMTSVLRVGRVHATSAVMDEDSADHVTECLRTLASIGNAQAVKSVYLAECRRAFSRMLQAQEERANLKKAGGKKAVRVQVDDLVSFRLLSAKGQEQGDEYEADLTRATGAMDRSDENSNKLNRIVQLTGFSDTVYAEAFVNVHQFDILLDVLIVNQTAETLQNLTLEFATLGDLKLVERPTSVNLAPHSFHTIKANIKARHVSSTETGVIFGNIVYDGPGLDSTCVILNDIHIDIMDYIHSASCTEAQFRSMWTEFEWENKVNVNTNITDLRAYLNHIMKCTNMNCLTPQHALEGDCGVLAANMYARSVFGEDALANICIEKQTEDSPIVGHIRIRSKTQGIALSLGDKITLSQKAATAAA